MQIGCTQMHTVTLVAIIIGLVTIGAQSALYLNRPQEKARLWYLGLLFLLLVFNIANGLFPNPAYSITVEAQHILVNGTGFMIASYFPFYFYKAFGLTRLRFLAVYGVPLFLLLPYLAFFVIGYSFHGDIRFTHRYGYIIPTGYSLVLLVAIGNAIRYAHHKNLNRNHYIEELATYLAIIPWTFIAPVVYFQWGQVMETLFTNFGFVTISALLLYRAVKINRAEQKQLENLRQLTMDTSVIEKNCAQEMLSPRETEIAILLCHRLRRREIADKLFISDRTVDKHTERIFLKIGVTSREELLEKLNKTP